MVVIAITDLWQFVLRAVGVGGIFLTVNIMLPRRTSGLFAGYDLMFLWLFGGLAAAPLVNGSVELEQSITAMLAVLACHLSLSRLALYSTTAAKLITGQPVLLVENGKVIRKNMRRALVPAWMLLAELRCAGLSDLSQVDYAILETCGRISVIPKSELWPVTAGDLGIKTSPVVQPSLLIEDGKILTDNLKRLNYDVQWLRRELSKQGVARLEDVYVASIDGHGQLCFSYKD
ncbi:uncharacterized membrane protein YcaP (DUF421 family) [Desulfohalotomaculum tongense]|uniref:DUF421 domain-containing protein n=1 Tax=Desulforadius tongensis TaxID=1216062 RepID=UPI00195E8A40|nr:DUF421 domain-containing protein [Desulforadius tongensis]MBM7856158.1 uncharacterized membrane protein YcaP (DUF421 family) [Desulforadius tongensis]